jgi:hypothetical protein
LGAEFEITFHEAERVLEVRYPARPTLDSYTRYESAMRETIRSLSHLPWKCLVDQSALSVMPPELPPRIVELNAWAKTKGMGQTVRVVKPSATAQLQVGRILKNSGAEEIGTQCLTREDAWAALVGERT